MMELSEIESPIKEHRVTPSDADTDYAASASASPSSTTASKPTDWWAFVKANVPSILSIISVLTNVIILSALIPSMKQDIAYMSGQADNMARSFSDMSIRMTNMNDKINSATGTLATFTGQIATIQASFNQTENTIMALKVSTEQDLGQMRLQASDILANFRNSSDATNAQMNHTFTLATAQEATLTLRANKTEAQVTEAEARVQILLVALDTVSNNSMSSILATSADATTKLQSVSNSSMASLLNISSVAYSNLQTLVNSSMTSLEAASYDAYSQLQQLNNSAVSSVIDVRDDFTQRVVPQTIASLQAYNYSNSIANLQKRMTAVETVDPAHYVGSPTTGKGSTFTNMVAADSGSAAPRFWTDRGIIYMEGRLAPGSCSTWPCVALNIASGYEPIEYKRFEVVADDGNPRVIVVWGNGDVVVQTSFSSWVTLDGIAYRRGQS